MLPLAAMIARWHGVPLWLQIHGIEAWSRPKDAVARAVAQVDFVTSVSRHTRRRFLEWASVEPRFVRVLPNTVHPRYRPDDRRRARARLNLDDGDRVLLTVGRMAASERYKGHDRVLDCLAGRGPERGEVRYLVAGVGDDSQRVQSRTKELGLSSVVRFLGRVPDDELPDVYRAADLFVMPSTGEGFGIVFLEAMACGTPALGLDGDGSNDPLMDGRLGRLTTQSGLCAAIGEELYKPRPPDLSSRTLAVFGPEAFQSQVAALMDHWWPTDGEGICAV